MEIPGATAVVTGASNGIGRAAARLLAQRGARVIALARSAERLEALVAEIAAAGGAAEPHPADLADPAAVDAIFDDLAARGVTPDILVNSAGAGRWLTTEETPPAEAVAMMNAPYFAAFFVTRRCLPGMLARRRGRIVNVNSPVAWSGWPGAAGYTAARYALRGFTNALRCDLHGTGVGVTSVTLGHTRSAYFDKNPGVLERGPGISRIVPVVTPEQVAAAIADGLARDRREVVLPAMLRVLVAVNTLAPRLVEWLLIRTGWRRPAG
ncbi:MAG: SDR family NAD(P)-dependent oxidoreductase [Anaerolineales bacterium]|nr:SDR family NAD(P)-dependent oxidoreductase [Anaerolineales bacterium]